MKGWYEKYVFSHIIVPAATIRVNPDSKGNQYINYMCLY